MVSPLCFIWEYLNLFLISEGQFYQTQDAWLTASSLPHFEQSTQAFRPPRFLIRNPLMCSLVEIRRKLSSSPLSRCELMYLIVSHKTKSFPTVLWCQRSCSSILKSEFKQKEMKILGINAEIFKAKSFISKLDFQTRKEKPTEPSQILVFNKVNTSL